VRQPARNHAQMNPALPCPFCGSDDLLPVSNCETPPTLAIACEQCGEIEGNAPTLAEGSGLRPRRAGVQPDHAYRQRAPSEFLGSVASVQTAQMEMGESQSKPDWRPISVLCLIITVGAIDVHLIPAESSWLGAPVVTIIVFLTGTVLLKFRHAVARFLVR
jgi:hypothetical protein